MFDIPFERVDPAVLDEEQLLAAMTTAQQAINRLTGWQLTCAAEFGQRRPAPELPAEPGGQRARWAGVSEFADAEIAAALTICRRAADRLLETALELGRLPATAAALAAGELDLPRVRLICAETAHLSDAEAAGVEARIIDRAPGQVYSQLRRTLRRTALTIAPTAEQQRLSDAIEDRRTWLEHDGGGRSRFSAEGPTHDILRIAAAVDAVGRVLDPHGATLAQRRFDALNSMADTILDDPALPATRFGPPGVVLLADTGTLARLTSDQPDRAPTRAPRSDTDTNADEGPVQLAGAQQRLVELAGDGPISDSLAVELLEAAHTVVIPYDPTARWDCDHTLGYQVPDRLARHLAGLHPRCVFPGCTMPVHRCDWDHVIPWPQGPTCACNLLPLCRYHHRLKTHTRWKLGLHPNRQLQWTSPTGRTYLINPDVDIGKAPAA